MCNLCTIYYADLIRYATVSCGATLTVNVEEVVYVPDKSAPAHISWTVKLPEVANPGTLAKLNCFVAVVEEVLMMNTWTPVVDFPE